jgi:DNA-binding response OmpR family regulator
VLTSQATILIVEDDALLQRVLADFLTAQGFATLIESRGDLAIATIREHNPAAVILDIIIPEVDGFEVCRQVRPDYQGAILILTGCDQEDDLIRGLESGADDYVTKPVTPQILLARLRALLRRVHIYRIGLGETISETFGDEPIHVGELTITPRSREVFIDSEPVALTTLEYELLALLATHVAQPLDRSFLYQELLDREYDGLARTLDVHISRLRRKLAEHGGSSDWIKTLHGRGYQLAIV